MLRFQKHPLTTSLLIGAPIASSVVAAGSVRKERVAFRQGRFLYPHWAAATRPGWFQPPGYLFVSFLASIPGSLLSIFYTESKEHERQRFTA